MMVIFMSSALLGYFRPSELFTVQLRDLQKLVLGVSSKC